MYSDDPRNSRPLTGSDYTMPTPQHPPSFLPPPDPARSNLSVGQSIPSTPRDSSADPYMSYPYPDREISATPNNSAPLLATSPHAAYKEAHSPYAGVDGAYDYDTARKTPFFKRPIVWFGITALVAAIVVAIVVPVVIVNHNNHKNSSSSLASNGGKGGQSGGNGGNTTTPGNGGGKPNNNLATWGGDGSTVTKADGTTFVYHNSFGGYWVADPENPFNNSAKPNSWTPALSDKWTWGVDRVNGVNLGGLFVIEPFIVPALYQQFKGSQDEWDLSTAAAASGNLTDILSQHYSTFITEEDIAEIAGAGLNWIRLPIPFWAIETWQDVGSDTPGGPPVAEPFLARVCWQYILQVLGWARKYGIRVNLDLHTAPGSQNGYNHSGKLGQVNFMNGVMGYANAQRMLDYIRIITEFISQPEWTDVVPMFSILNEALLHTIGQDSISHFYLQAHNMMRSITGLGEGHGPIMTIHDGFSPLSSWANFLPGSDRIFMDTHPYFAFDGQPNTAPIDVPAVGGDGTMMGGTWPQQACNAWGGSLNDSRSNFGVTVAGEFSNAINDCGLYVRGVANGPQYSGDCTVFNNVDQWSDNMKNGFSTFILASMDALGDYFFWTWKIGNDSVTGTVQAPLWSYKLGLDNGFIPKDPRTAKGMCAKLGVRGSQFDGTFQPWQTGGAGAGTIDPSAVEEFSAWPPASLAGVPNGQVNAIPSYTATKAPVTLPPPTFSPSPTASVGNGWFDNQDTAQINTAVSGCVYPDAWNAQDSPIPANACGAGAAGAAAAPTPAPTPPPASVPVVPTAPTLPPTSPSAQTTAIVAPSPAVRAVHKKHT